jgi:hypothetical protein
VFGLNKAARDRAEIIRLLGEIHAVLVPPLDEPSDECQHPEERRVSLRTFGGDHWICAACKHEHIG